jgi:hypothetical protein
VNDSLDGAEPLPARSVATALSRYSPGFSVRPATRPLKVKRLAPASPVGREDEVRWEVAAEDANRSPVGLIRPIPPSVPPSVYQRFPSGPALM